MSEYASLIRVVQMFFGSVIGLIAIYFGYRLFAEIPPNKTNDGPFKFPAFGEVKVKAAPASSSPSSARPSSS